VRKVGNNEFEITQLKENSGFKTPLSSNFSVVVPGATLGTDYNLKVEDLPNKKKVNYLFSPINNFDLSNKTADFSLLNQNNLLDDQHNTLRNQYWSLPLDSKNAVVSGTSIASPLIAAAAITPLIAAPVIAANTSLPTPGSA
jgi:hypothetical protein